MYIRRDHPLYLDQRGVDTICMTLNVRMLVSESNGLDDCDERTVREALYVKKINSVIDELRRSGLMTK